MEGATLADMFDFLSKELIRLQVRNELLHLLNGLGYLHTEQHDNTPSLTSLMDVKMSFPSNH